MGAYLEAGLWLDLAKSANGYAASLAAGLAKIPGVRLPWTTDANEIFVILPAALDASLKAAGAYYYAWGLRNYPSGIVPPGEKEVFIRLVTSYVTSAEDVERFLKAASA
jgi:threonine aldolase